MLSLNTVNGRPELDRGALNLAEYTGPPELRAKLVACPLVAFTARQSGMGGDKARKAAAQEMELVAKAFQELTGLDMSPLLPTAEEVVRGLAAAEKHKSKEPPDGHPFTNEFLVIDRSEQGLLLFYSTGPASKLDEGFEQPYLRELKRLMLLHRPGVLFANRLDRIARIMLPSAELLHILQCIDCLLGDAKHGIKGASAFDHLITMWQAGASEEEVKNIPKKTREGQVARTDTRMVDGIVRYACAVTPPPGLMAVRMVGERRTEIATRLSIDTPSLYPPRNQVAYGLPDIWIGDLRVDQSATVQAALKMIGRSHISQVDVGRFLIANKFSTQRLRERQGPRAHFDLDHLEGQAGRAVRAIMDNLDFYETGVFHIAIGWPGVPDVDIVNCFPPSGQWASQEDFERIRDFLATGGRGGGPAKLALTGVPVLTDGGPARLQAAPKERSSMSPAYKVDMLNADDDASSLPAIPHEALAQSIIDGLMSASETRLIPIAEVELPGEVELLARLATQEALVNRLERKRRTILGRLRASDDDGNAVMPATMWAEVSAEAEELNETIAKEQASANEMKAQAEVLREESQKSQHAIQDTGLLRLVASLRNPSDTSFNNLWKTALTITSMARTRARENNHDLAVITWSGTLTISGEANIFVIPFRGCFETGAATKAHDRANSVVQAMLAGTPFGLIHAPQKRELTPLVANLLGATSKTFILGSCPDPRLTAVGTFISLHREDSDAEIAQQLGEPEAIVTKMRAVMDGARPHAHLMKQQSRRNGLFYALADRSAGRVSQEDLEAHDVPCWSAARQNLLRSKDGGSWTVEASGTLLLTPCTCGSHRRSPSRLPLVTGLLCLDCHTDEAGLEWPSEPYDHWLEIDGVLKTLGGHRAALAA